MTTSLRFTCSLAGGLHARPASVLGAALADVPARVTIRKSASLDSAADARSVLSIVALDIRLGDEFEIEITGEGIAAAERLVRELIERRLPSVEAAAVPVSVVSGAASGGGAARRCDGRLPAPLCARTDLRVLTGIGIGEAVAIGRGLLIRGSSVIATAMALTGGGDVGSALDALRRVRADLLTRAASGRDQVQRLLLEAHAAIAGDPALHAEVARNAAAGLHPARALATAFERFASLLAGAQSEITRQRAADVRDVCEQALGAMGFADRAADAPALNVATVVLAQSLTPGRLMGMSRAHLAGLVLAESGLTSHVVILARSMGVPTLVGADESLLADGDGREIALDAPGGVAIIEPDERVKRYYALDRAGAERRSRRLSCFIARRGVTADGASLHVAVNAATPEDVAAGVGQGADGVGLLRTELLFSGRAAPPSRDEQAAIYERVLRNADGRHVIIRVLDVGGDKPLDYLPMPAEANPFLGLRGIRLLMARPEILDEQLTAIAQASHRVNAQAWVMAPMVALATEAAWFRSRVERAWAGVPGAAAPRVGVMIETPAAAYSVDLLAPFAEFFSIGTNDLTQYVFAADRGNGDIAARFASREPALLRAIAGATKTAKGAGRWIGICGDMAADPVNLPLFVGMGVDEVSVSGVIPAELKSRLSELSASACAAVTDRALACADALAVERLLREAPCATASPVFSPTIIDLAVDAADKAEAIKHGVDLLWAAGRVADRRALEHAVWAREATYSTSMIPGVAIPHCASPSISAPSVAVLRLRRAVEWAETAVTTATPAAEHAEATGVRTIFLLVVPGVGGADSPARGTAPASGHMKILAKLARKLVHDEFRRDIDDASDADALSRMLAEQIVVS